MTGPLHHLCRRTLIVAAAFAGLLPSNAAAEAPLIDHQGLVCSLPGKNPRVCATIADDGEVKKARVYFRAVGQKSYYWSEMTLDFRNFCATLPVPTDKTKQVEYHVWAIDDQLETRRTDDIQFTIDPNQSCDHPVIDEDPERIANLVVTATSHKQGKKLQDFKPQGVDFRHLKKRGKKRR